MNISWNFTFCCFIALLISCSGGQGQQLEGRDGFAVMPAAKQGERVATFAGGCFWAMQECLIELKGVHKVISGYSGGSKANPTYAEMLSKTTGHAEAVQVYYDPQLISFEQLTKAFFYAHDPTQLNGQGPDIGPDYRSIVFFRSPEEYNTIRKIITNIDSSGIYNKPVVTEILPYQMIYGAEMDHQDYYKKNSWDPYIRNVSRLKVMKLREEMPALIKKEYLN